MHSILASEYVEAALVTRVGWFSVGGVTRRSTSVVFVGGTGNRSFLHRLFGSRTVRLGKVRRKVLLWEVE